MSADDRQIRLCGDWLLVNVRIPVLCADCSFVVPPPNYVAAPRVHETEAPEITLKFGECLRKEKL